MNCVFDEAAADRACQFFEDHLQHVEGLLAGKPFTLESWQRKIVADLFGWKRPNGTRRYRTAYIEVPRKNGKSTLAAGLALYLLLADREAGAQVYSAAGDRGQARIVFDAAKKMVDQNPMLASETECFQNRIVGKRAGGFYTSLSAEAYSKHGFNAHGVIFDELHVQPDRELWDVLTTSMGARTQPLTVAITTAGHDRSSICWELHQRAKSAIEDPESDPYFYPCVFGADENDDWTDEGVWQKANPNYGVSLTADFMREKCEEAKRSPSFENTFRRLHLNQWTEQAERYLQMDKWDKCKRDFTIQDMVGKRCFGGFDLASTRDTNSFNLLFPMGDDTYRTLGWYWAPRQSVSDRAHQDRRQVLNWGNQGLITLTDGDMVDCRRMATEIVELCSLFDVELIGYDKAGIGRPVMQMMAEMGFDIENRAVEYSQGRLSMSPPTKTLDILVGSQKLHHNGDPVLRWMAGNLAVKIDHQDNHQPSKSNSADKIDGVIALIMALGLTINKEQNHDNWYVPGKLSV